MRDLPHITSSSACALLDVPNMNSIPSATTAAMQPVATGKDQMTVSVMKMEQDQTKSEGKAALKLMSSAAEVQVSGKGGNVDVSA